MVPELSDTMRTKDNNEVKAVRLEREVGYTCLS
jgi:hypothetical protein